MNQSVMFFGRIFFYSSQVHIYLAFDIRSLSVDGIILKLHKLCE